MISKEEQMVASEDFRIIKEVTYKQLYGKKYKCFSGEYAWCYIIKFAFVYIGWITYFMLHDTIIQNIVKSVNNPFPYTAFYSQTFIFGVGSNWLLYILSFPLLGIPSLFLFSLKHYKINEVVPVTEIINNTYKIPNEFLNYLLIHKYILKYNRIAIIITLILLTVLSCIVSFMNYNKIYMSETIKYTNIIIELLIIFLKLETFIYLPVWFEFINSKGKHIAAFIVISIITELLIIASVLVTGILFNYLNVNEKYTIECLIINLIIWMLLVRYTVWRSKNAFVKTVISFLTPILTISAVQNYSREG